MKNTKPHPIGARMEALEWGAKALREALKVVTLRENHTSHLMALRQARKALEDTAWMDQLCTTALRPTSEEG